VVVVVLRDEVVVGLDVVDDTGVDTVVPAGVSVDVTDEVSLVVVPVATTGPGLSGVGLACWAGFVDRAATAANTVATTIPATPSAAYGGRRFREPSLVGITAA
jgi:hypothetical protein